MKKTGLKDHEALIYIPEPRRKLKVGLSRHGKYVDACLVAVTFTLFAITSLWLLYPTQLNNFLNYFQCGRGNGVNGTLPPAADPTCDITFESDRFDCWPESVDASETKCLDRGCCWDTAAGQGVPTCYFPRNFANTYKIVSSRNTSTGMNAVLQRTTASPYPGDILELALEVTYETNQRLRVKLSDSKNQRYQVPIDLQKGEINAPNPDYYVAFGTDPFSILVRRKSTGELLFDSSVVPLIYADQFLQMGTQLATNNIYGLGEHRNSFKLNTQWTKVVFWARDQPPTLQENLYGSHPFYMNLDGANNAHGVFLLNSNAMEVALQPHGESSALTYRTIGGILDFYIFTGPTPDDVVRQYVSLIGKPYLPPYWALGYHLCKYGYNSAAELKKVIERNREARIPYDVQWNDIDYMSTHLDWTYDNTTYAGLPAIVEDLHKNNQKYVIIVDPGISVRTPYAPYDDGIADDIFVKDHEGNNLIGKVWPGETVFPDFFHPKAGDWWYREAKMYYDNIPFDGLWTDMNEPSNFVDGSTKGCTNNSLDKPPFIPPTIDGGSLYAKTICPSATQSVSSHYNVHSMYGFSEARATMDVLTKLTNQRSIVISRSTFPSSGRYGGHWLGDNKSGWPDLYFSIPGILNFQMFGIPLVGADICGFGDDTTPELCIRWTQLGAFYPFMRNHDALGRKDQDPGSFDQESRDMMKDVIEHRYSLIPYLYTLFYRSHVDGTAIARPLFFLYPGEAQEVDTQFMWGTALLITPVLEDGARTVTAYIPNDIWYDFYNGSRLTNVGPGVVLDAPLEKINLHVRGGSIIPSKATAATTADQRVEPFSLLVALGANGFASGELFWDDGQSLNSIDEAKYSHVSFSVTDKVLTSEVIAGQYTNKREMNLQIIFIYGVEDRPSNVTVNDVTAEFEFDEAAQSLIILLITNNVELTQPFKVTW